MGTWGPRRVLTIKVCCYFYWVGQKKDISQWCISCPTCCFRKTPIPAPCTPMQLDPVKRPLHRVATYSIHQKKVTNQNIFSGPTETLILQLKLYIPRPFIHTYANVLNFLLPVCMQPPLPCKCIHIFGPGQCYFTMDCSINN